MQRYEVRLQSLSHAALVRLAAEGMRGCRQTRSMGDAMLAEESPLPDWASDVLTSADLLGPVLASLSLRDSPSARVCTAWRDAWRAKQNRVSLVYQRSVQEVLHLDPLPDAGPESGYIRHVTPMPGGGVLVPDYNDYCVKILTVQGSLSSAFEVKCRKCAVGYLETPSAVALLSDNHDIAWVLLEDPGSIVKIRLEDELDDEEEGVLQRIDGYGHIRDIAVADDKLYVLVPSAVNVHSAATGDYKFTFSSHGSGTDQLLYASSIEARDGLVYVADMLNHRIQVFSSDGNHVRSIGRGGEAPAWIGDDTWVDDLEDDGRLDPRAGSLPGEFDQPFGIAVGHGRLYVSERRGCRIQTLTLEGEPLHMIDSPDGEHLSGMCVDGDRFWVVGEHAMPSDLHLFTLTDVSD